MPEGRNMGLPPEVPGKDIPEGWSTLGQITPGSGLTYAQMADVAHHVAAQIATESEDSQAAMGDLLRQQVVEGDGGDFALKGTIMHPRVAKGVLDIVMGDRSDQET